MMLDTSLLRYRHRNSWPTERLLEWRHGRKGSSGILMGNVVRQEFEFSAVEEDSGAEVGEAS
ncbi:MAG: hypothetical protein SGJ19_18930, partial [Planctomycetia bacterium]|nr:hypothetical protein [Planctomycetia bacterium]